MISYENVGSAADWLGEAFGFRERGERYAEPDGTVSHAELELDGAVVMLGWPGPEYRNPARHAEACEQAQMAPGAACRRRGAGVCRGCRYALRPCPGGGRNDSE
jgi:hypothetical protein